MAQALKAPSAARSLARAPKTRPPPLTNPNGTPLLRRDPGILPPGSNIIKFPSPKRPALPESHTQNATPLEHGTEIYMFSHVRTNQIIYSLTRHLRSSPAMSQLSFFGKKTRPAGLRKDLWLPVLMVQLNNAKQGQEVWKRLRELKRLHELHYDKEVITEKEGLRKGQLMVRKKRAKVLMDQKAWAVADLGMVMNGLEPKWVTEERRREKKEQASRAAKAERMEVDRKRKEEMRKKKERHSKTLPMGETITSYWRYLFKGTEKPKRPEAVPVEKALPPVETEEGLAARRKEEAKQAREEKRRLELKEALSLDGVVIRWADPRNSRWVEEWPLDIVHEKLGRSRYSAAWPLPPKAESDSIEEKVVVDEVPMEAEKPASAADEESKKPWYQRLI